MIDDFAPKKPQAPRPKPPEQLTGFRPSTNLPEHSGENLMPQLEAKPYPVANPPQASSISTLANSPTPQRENTTNNTELPIKKKRSKKKFVVITLLLFALVGLGMGGWYFGIRDSGEIQTASIQTTDDTSSVEEVPAEETTTLVMAPLSGLDVTAETANRPVTAVMIENSGEARPQSGLLEADVIFEAIAEGGISRFLALYQNGQPDIIGPIRSARPYYAEWAAAFDASYVHAGGSPDGLQRIRDLSVKDVSAFSDSEIFYRTSTRFAPHNLYSSMKGLDQINQLNGFTSSTFTPWERKKDVVQTPNASSISIAISSDFYNVSYAYNPETNSYVRSLGGEAHIDEVSGKQLTPKVVVAMVKSRSQSGIYSVYNTTGNGQVLVFQDGRVIEGTWRRDGPKDQYTFTDKYGFPLMLNKGQTWISVVTDTGDVTYK